MFRNYLVTALRNATRHKLYSFINIAGLMVGLACAIFIALFLRDELSYDAWIPGSHNVYRVETTYKFPGDSGPENLATAPFVLADAMQSGIPEVQSAARIVPEDMTVKAGNHQFPESIAFVDSNFFSVVRLPLILGSATHALAGPGSVVVSQRMARKYFGTTDVIGRILTIAGQHPLTITAILRDPPHNSSFQHEFYVSNKSKADTFGDRTYWFSPESYIYVRLLPGADPARVIEKTRAIFRRDADPGVFLSNTSLTGDRIIQARLVPLPEVHLIGDEAGDHNAGSWTTVYGFAAIAGLILAIACFNFTNLATARAMVRTREVSLRKVVGAKRRQLVTQFLGESVLTALLALILALALVEMFLPAYDGFLGRPISFSYLRDWPLALAVVAVTTIVGGFAGLYPAFVLSGFRPAATLRSDRQVLTGAGLLRTSLVVLQFAISIGLGIAATVVFAQIRYAERLDLGFNRDNMMVLDGADNLTEAERQSLMHRLGSNPDIAGATESSAAPFAGLYQGTVVGVPGGTQTANMRIMTVTPDFFGLYEIKLLAGRFLSLSHGSDVSTEPHLDSDSVAPGENILINAAAARKLGFTPQAAVGQIVRVGHLRTPVRVVGVTGDAKFYGARSDIDPTVYVDRPNRFYVISVRVKGGHIPAALAFIDKTWTEFAPTLAIRRHFLDDSYDDMFAAVEKQGRIFGLFFGIAISIACLGLFGLAVFTAERRTKEIGIRKAFGARTRDIVWLLLWQFSIPVLLANLIAWPVAWYYLHGWLESYAYRISLDPIYFAAAGFAALVIAWATVAAHTVRVARANPIHALRYE